jgi:5-formyltetrahydrofolate cyclo-ligase
MPTGEIQTDTIVRHALNSGKQVFVPYLHKSPNPSPDTPRSVMDMVDLRSLSDYDSLKRDSWGIPTIEEETVHERQHVLRDSASQGRKLDLILMPGVAFDIDPNQGYLRRLGHGKGFYDYFLHRYMQDRKSQVKELSRGPGIDVLLYGLALKEQFLQAEAGLSVPVGEHDYLLHGLLVGNGKFVDGVARTS